MKGVIFRSFETFVSDKFNEDVIELAMGQPSLSTSGAYTSVGHYPHTDFLTLAVSVAEQTGTPIKNLVIDFGEILFHILAKAHADMVQSYDSPIALLSVIESVIHRDVRKIYTNTELPRFDILERDENKSVYLDYSSARPFADLAEGLIKGCLDYYQTTDSAQIEREDVKPDGTHSRFKVSIHQDAKTR